MNFAFFTLAIVLFCNTTLSMGDASATSLEIVKVDDALMNQYRTSNRARLRLQHDDRYQMAVWIPMFAAAYCVHIAGAAQDNPLKQMLATFFACGHLSAAIGMMAFAFPRQPHLLLHMNGSSKEKTEINWKFFCRQLQNDKYTLTPEQRKVANNYFMTRMAALREREIASAQEYVRDVQATTQKKYDPTHLNSLLLPS